MRQDQNLKILELDLPGLHESNDTMVRSTFRDFTEWMEMANAPAPSGSFAALGQLASSCNSHKVDRDTNPWYGSKSWDEAVQLATYGWPEGLAEIQKFITKFESIIAGLLPIPEVVFDVSGDWLDMGRFLSGEPEDFASLRDSEDTVETTNAKIVRIGLNMSASCSYDTTTIMRRGAACVALMHMLELCGITTNLDVVEANTGNIRDETYINIKRAGETLSPEQLAFATVHPSMLRRFQFAKQEKLPLDMAERSGAASGGFGMPAQVLLQENYDIYLPSVTGYGDDETAVAWVLQTLREQGIPIEERK